MLIYIYYLMQNYFEKDLNFFGIFLQKYYAIGLQSIEAWSRPLFHVWFFHQKNPLGPLISSCHPIVVPKWKHHSKQVRGNTYKSESKVGLLEEKTLIDHAKVSLKAMELLKPALYCRFVPCF